MRNAERRARRALAQMVPPSLGGSLRAASPVRDRPPPTGTRVVPTGGGGLPPSGRTTGGLLEAEPDVSHLYMQAWIAVTEPCALLAVARADYQCHPASGQILHVSLTSASVPMSRSELGEQLSTATWAEAGYVEVDPGTHSVDVHVRLTAGAGGAEVYRGTLIVWAVQRAMPEG